MAQGSGCLDMAKCSAYPPTHGDKSARGPQPKTFSKSFCLLLRSVLKLKLIPKKHHILRHIFCLHPRDKIKLDLIGNQTVSIRYERRFSEILQFQLINKTSGPHPKRGREQQGAWSTGPDLVPMCPPPHVFPRGHKIQRFGQKPP